MGFVGIFTHFQFLEGDLGVLRDYLRLSRVSEGDPISPLKDLRVARD